MKRGRRRCSTTCSSRSTAAARSPRRRRCWPSPAASATRLQAIGARRRRGVGDGQDHRSADRDGPRGVAVAARPRDGSAARLGRADRGLDARPGAAGARHRRRVADREPVRHPHRRLVQQGARPQRRDARGWCRSSGAGRVVIVAGFQGVTGQRRHHHARPRRRRHHRRRPRRGAATPRPTRTAPTSTASTPPIRASSPTPAASRT